MKKTFVLLMAIAFLAGCAGMGLQPDPRIDQLEAKVKKLERQVMMGTATGAGANIYPVTGALTGGGTGALDKITSVAAGDAALVMFKEEGTWGNAFMPFGLDAANSGTEASPYLINSGDATDDWKLLDTYGRRLFGHVQVVSDADGCTVGADCDGTLVRLAWGGVILSTGAATVTLPEIVATTPSATQVDIGASICIVQRDDNEILTIDVHGNDSITLDGTKDTAGDSIKTTVAALTGGGDFICLLAIEADNWMVMGYKGTWTAN